MVGLKIVILGAGISGHTAALFLKKKLGKKHEVIVVSPNQKWNWIPSNIWVGVGKMKVSDVTFDLQKVYKRAKIDFRQAKALSIHPEGDTQNNKSFVKVESTLSETKGQVQTIEYDYLINATGPKLNFSATEGLGPEAGNSLSVCTSDHAKETWDHLLNLIQQMKQGQTKTFVVGMGHGLCTCEGAAFEYTFNLDFVLRSYGVRDKAKIIYLTNEADLGDFGVDGMHLQHAGYTIPSRVMAESLFQERDIDWVLGAHVTKVGKNKVEYTDLEDRAGVIDFDFAMLLPPFTGVGLKVYDKDGADKTSDLFAPNQFMKVDANYESKPYEEWSPEDWPKTYQTKYPNIFSIGIAFAPPHQISRPRKSKNGVLIAPAPPRTGMPSAIMGRTVAESIADMVNGKSNLPTKAASMAEMGAACVASAGAHLLKGSAVSITMYPVVKNYKRYPEYGRSLVYTTGEIGLAGHWIKTLLHYAFIYKAKALPLWWIIPE